MKTVVFDGGFSDPAVQSAQWFLAIMEAMARPGTLWTLDDATPPAPVSCAAGAALLTLCDADTPLYLAGAHDTDAIRKWVVFHTGAPLAEPGRAAFGMGTWEALAPLSVYPKGLPAYPDRSATLIVESETLSASGATLAGPGIRTTAQLSFPEIAAFQENRALFPLGLDFLFTSGNRVAALPRTTEVT